MHPYKFDEDGNEIIAANKEAAESIWKPRMGDRRNTTPGAIVKVSRETLRILRNGDRRQSQFDRRKPEVTKEKYKAVLETWTGQPVPERREKDALVGIKEKAVAFLQGTNPSNTAMRYEINNLRLCMVELCDVIDRRGK